MAPHIFQIGNGVLRRRAKAVEQIGAPEIRSMIAELIQAMRDQELVGIAAPQLGYGARIFVTEIRATSLRPNLAESDDLRVFINPKILKLSQQTVTLYEGCGSVAAGQLLGPVRRPKKVAVQALSRDGKGFTLIAGGLLGRVIQHEYDHLNGILCLDKFTDTKKVMDRGEYLKQFDTYA